MDKEDLMNDLLVFESHMEESYLPSYDIKDYTLDVPSKILMEFKSNLKEANFYIEDESVIREIIVGLIKGNIILVGPPGTGKTTITKIICDSFNTEQNIITAIDDWTTYDTIGGYFPSVDDEGREIVVGKNGRLVDSVVKCCDTIIDAEKKPSTSSAEKKQASWLVIDELNRCEIDKVFGDFLTALGSSDISSDNIITLEFQSVPQKKKLYIPNRYRIIGLMNNIDKNFVYDLSQAVTRRFQFISINPPKNIENEIKFIKSDLGDRIGYKIGKYSNNNIDNSFIENTFYEDSIFKSYEEKLLDFIKHVRLNEDSTYLGFPLGTAQIKDLYENILVNMIICDYKNIDEDQDKEKMLEKFIDESFSNIIIPQFENFDLVKKEAFYEYISNNDEWNWMNLSKIKLYEMIK